MEYQGIVFDFNGTLFFDNDKHVKAWNEISKILRGKEITLEELHTKLNGTPNIQNILYFTDGKATKEELEKYSQKKEEYYRQFCKEDTEKFHLVDGVCEFFDHLLLVRVEDSHFSKKCEPSFHDHTQQNRHQKPLGRKNDEENFLYNLYEDKYHYLIKQYIHL